MVETSGLLIVLSGPSGAGKGTLCKMLREEMPELGYSVSVTTRAPRIGEEEGINYYYIDKDTRRMIVTTNYLNGQKFMIITRYSQKQVLDILNRERYYFGNEIKEQ